jgi:hypothetical protein
LFVVDAADDVHAVWRLMILMRRLAKVLGKGDVVRMAVRLTLASPSASKVHEVERFGLVVRRCAVPSDATAASWLTPMPLTTPTTLLDAWSIVVDVVAALGWSDETTACRLPAGYGRQRIAPARHRLT